MDYVNPASSRRPSLAASLAAWVFVTLGTLFFSLLGLFIFWPLSIIFERANGQLPHQVSQFWAKTLCRALPFWYLQVVGLEKIQKGKTYVVVGNHQSMLDILVVLASLPLHFKFIAKRELFWIPFFGWHLWVSRYISLKRGDPESGKAALEKARHWLRQGVNILFFPEGTRSLDGRLQDFKAGAFKLGLEEHIDFLPVVIQGTRDAMPKRSFLLQIPIHMSLHVLSPVSAQNFSIEDLEKVRDLVRDRMMEKLSQLE